MDKIRTSSDINLFLSDYIDWDLRAKGEKDFFARQLRRFNCKRVFDACLGVGFDTINLLKSGFDVTSNEIDDAFREVALRNAAKEGLELKLTSGYDWRELPESLNESYDAVICLGNSFTYLFDKEDRENTLRNFRRILRPGGILILDHRNYDYMLDKREGILRNPAENFRYSAKYYYCGDRIRGYPVIIEDQRVVMEYLKLRTGNKAHLVLYPLRREEIRTILLDVGMTSVDIYGDFELGKVGVVDFYQHIGVKE